MSVQTDEKSALFRHRQTLKQYFGAARHMYDFGSLIRESYFHDLASVVRGELNA